MTGPRPAWLIIHDLVRVTDRLNEADHRHKDNLVTILMAERHTLQSEEPDPASPAEHIAYLNRLRPHLVKQQPAHPPAEQT